MGFLGLLLWFSASFGMQDYLEANTDLYQYMHPPIFTEIELHAENDWLDLYAIYRNEMKKGDLYFIPEQDYFTVGAEFSVGSLSLNIEHMCQHPVSNWGNMLNGEYGGYNRIWIQVSSKDL